MDKKIREITVYLLGIKIEINEIKIAKSLTL